MNWITPMTSNSPSESDFVTSRQKLLSLMSREELEAQIRSCRKIEKVCSQDLRSERKQGLDTYNTITIWGMMVSHRNACQEMLNA